MLFWILYWIIGLTVVCSIPAFFGWLFWWPIRLFFFSLIPAHAAYAWVGKLVIIFMVCWIGGIGIPIITFMGGMFMLCGVASSLSNNRSSF